MNKNSIDNTNLLNWMLKGDPAIVYQVHRDLLDTDKSKLELLRKEISKRGWGKKFLEGRDKQTGLWGNGIYTPKWISTTYTLLDIKKLGIDPGNNQFVESAEIIIDKLWKIPRKKSEYYLDLCICGMILDVCCYAEIKSSKMNEIIDYILEKQFPDGGWNCLWERNPHHSSVHTTINILEGLKEYKANRYSYHRHDLNPVVKKAHEFLLMHKLFKSDKTGKIIDLKMIRLSYPPRWRYDILRCMDYFRLADQKFDPRMNDALNLIMKKKKNNNRWLVRQKHPGRVHFDMEKTGKESRWNTLRVLRVLKKYRKEDYNYLMLN
ncbi:MAG: hypothetical protein APR63_08940 [Desulfuromonas sp. SDB]|nr:MAG: hypothetical protein APR63_08940 [Desulfuromonas sp. SDB]